MTADRPAASGTPQDATSTILPNPRSLSVVVVAHDDSSTLASTVERVVRALTITVEEYEIIIVDDGSSDDTPQVSERIAARHESVRVLRNPLARGIGHSFMGAVESTVGKAFVVYIPGNNTWPYRSFLELFGNIGKADVLTSYPINLLDTMSATDRIVSRGYTFLINLLLGRGLSYYNGLTVYPTEFLRKAQIGTRGFGFQAEALLKATFAGYSFLEVALPVDEGAVGRARAASLDNILSAGGTLLRVVWELRIANQRFSRLRVRETMGFGQGIDELGYLREKSRGAATTPPASPSRLLHIVIAGASSGIGAALCEALAADGHRLYVCARRLDKLEAVAGASGRTKALACDVSRRDEVEAFARFVGTFTPAIDVLINCAGGFGAIGPLADTEDGEWWSTLEVNLRGTYLMVKSFLPLLKKSAAGRIVNFSGGGAFSPFMNYSAYACSKAAVVRLTECLAVELVPDGITVNAVAPGIMASEIHAATLSAGPKRAGKLQYQRTQAILRDGGAPMANVIDCVRTLVSPAMSGLTGKTISSNFDPWATPAFEAFAQDITRSDLYSMRRINVVNLPDGFLKSKLQKAWRHQGNG